MQNIKKKNILITGGSGYIGGNLANYLCKFYDIFVIDKKLPDSYLKLKKKINFKKCNILEKDVVENYIKEKKINIIIHLAALTSVPESEIKKKKYKKNNITGSKIIIDICKNLNIEYFIFASSSAVYGNPKKKKVSEKNNLRPTNYYGFTKKSTELYIQNQLHNKINYSILRFFNVSGAIESFNYGMKKSSNQLIKKIAEKITKKNFSFEIYGKNYETKDGTAIRDYIHIKDIIKIHHLILKKYINKKKLIINCGNGFGFSVLEIIKTFERITKKKFRIKYTRKRKGDIKEIISNNSTMKKLFFIKNKKKIINSIVNDTYVWIKKIYRN